MLINEIKRESLGEFPTPLQKLENLSRHFSGPKIYIKRDDLNGIGTGGNKVRKLEYAFAEAASSNATDIITSGSVQSNHTRLTLACANKQGLTTHLIITGKKPDRASGNFLINLLMGADSITFVKEDIYSSRKEKSTEVEKKAETLSKEIIENGGKPYYIPNGCKGLHGALGYSQCIFELINQFRSLKTAPTHVITGCGTAGTLTGLVLGSHLYAQEEIEVIGISISREKRELQELILDKLSETIDYLGIQTEISKALFQIYDEFVGEGYGAFTKSMQESIKLLARTEGIILDPVYTGKAMSGLLQLINEGEFGKDDNVVFLHTGGLPGLFVEENNKFVDDIYQSADIRIDQNSF